MQVKKQQLELDMEQQTDSKLEKEMATHSSILAWGIQGMESKVGCCLWGRSSRT